MLPSRSISRSDCCQIAGVFCTNSAPAPAASDLPLQRSVSTCRGHSVRCIRRRCTDLRGGDAVPSASDCRS